MARTTSQLRTLWGPACTGPWARVDLYGAGAVVVRASIVDAVRALNSCLVRHNYPTRALDTGGYNCRSITGGSGYSLHAMAIAIDLNWTTNPYGPRLVTDMPPAMVIAIKAIRTRCGGQVWRWGGDFAGNKDAMHFEVIASPAEIATGIDPASLPPTEVIMANPVGNVDVVEPTLDGRVRVAGWTFDPDQPAASIDAHVQLIIEGQLRTAVLPTNVYREDVNNAHAIFGLHGFDAIVDPPSLPRELTVVLFGVDGQGATELGRRTVTVYR
jgi:hypothetical protein